ncbi:placenta-specific gene 8 protein-like [Plakobranchus ocellatus]|uniref:Placenta-specific gene 8 protein-like n=1 Tax=Plakobranchus ocellatus TaxID=259542 RepID=A0AAV4A9H2_9GAST|nr:placenta-specific gene 8 protein-like [Plakobranchus ocellatus]
MLTQNNPPQYDQKGYVPPPQVGYGHTQVVQSQPVGGTTVIVQQPIIQGKRDWHTGVCDCTEDCGICLCATFCGPCFLCQLATDMDENCCVALCVPAPVLVLRTKWRTQNNIQGDICDDCLLTSLCGSCVACQLAREVKMARENITYQSR